MTKSIGNVASRQEANGGTGGVNKSFVVRCVGWNVGCVDAESGFHWYSPLSPLGMLL